jgi:excisionase family DNA binding protein
MRIGRWAVHMTPLLTVHEAAGLLRLSEAAVRSLCEAGLLSHRRPSEGEIRIDRADVQTFLVRLGAATPNDPDLRQIPAANTGDAKGNPAGDKAAPATRLDPLSGHIESLVERLGRIEEMLASLVEREQVRDHYSTEEVGRLVGKAEFTVREWCRLGRIRATKKHSGRGKHAGWVVSHEEILRYRKEGLLPQPR